MSESAAKLSLEQRFPALARLGRARARARLDPVQQLEAADCGAACLTVVLRYYGAEHGLDELREALAVSSQGVSARDIILAGRRFGLRGRGVQLDSLDELELVPRGAILHWEFNHFVVFDGVGRRGVTLIDPAVGRRRVSLAEFDRAFTGVALILEPGASFVRRRGRAHAGMRAYLARILAHPQLWGRALLSSVVIQLLALGLPLATTLLVDRILPRRDLELLTILALGLALMMSFQFLASWVRANILVSLRTLLDAELTMDFVAHLVDLPYAFFQRRSAGDLMMRLASNATVREILSAGAMSAALDGPLVLIYLGLILALSPTMAGVVSALALAQLSLYLVTRRRQRELMSESLAIQAKTSSYEVELLAGIEALKSMGAEDRATERWSTLFVDALNVELRRGRLDALVGALLGGMSTAAPLIILGVGAKLVLSDALSLGAMLGIAALGSGFLVPLTKLVNVALSFQVLGSYLERLEDVLETAPEQDPAGLRPAPRLRGAIRAEEVDFRYVEAGPLAVDKVDLAIEPGEFVAFVGPSGAGKSTLAKLLIGLHRPARGRISYDGVELGSVDLRSLRAQLGVVTQAGELFAGTIRDNIALARPELDLDAVIEAAKLAAIHDEIVALPMGYDTILADGGASLSGGQRQRLALARALAGRPAILLLDEATSNLDTVTEAAIQAALEQLACTRLVIAHRLSTVASADRIVVMERGTIVETGTHAELLDHGRLYPKLYGRELQ